eukprot:627270-Rhodomonas_salina.1
MAADLRGCAARRVRAAPPTWVGALSLVQQQTRFSTSTCRSSIVHLCTAYGLAAESTAKVARSKW